MAQGRMNPYIYDPSKQIRQDLGNAAMSVEQGFQNVLDRKKQEYDFVNKVYQDAELMKKDLNIHNYELITKRSNDLIKETASAIKEKGKVDFQKLGELKQKVSSIADAKRNSELSVQAYGEVMKLVQANAANMRNPIETVTKIMGKLKDENYLFSPRNMYETAMEDYKDGLDYSKIIGEKIQELQKRGTPVMGQFDAKDGALIEYKGVVPFRFRLNQETKQLEPADEIDPKTGIKTDILSEIANTIDSELWNGYMKQTVGFGQMLNPNKEDFAKDFINSILGGSISYVTKEDALKRNTARTNAKLKEVQLGNALYEASPEQRALDRQKDELDITYKKASIGNMAADNSLAQQRLQQDKEEFAYKKEQDKKEKNSGGDNGSPVIDTAGTYSAPMKNSKGDPVIRIGKKGNTYYAVDKNNKAKAINEFEANYIINSLPKEERPTAKQALGNKAVNTTTPAPVLTKKPKPY